MRVSNPDRSSASQPQLQPALLEIVSDDFPVLHLDFSRSVACHERRLRTIANAAAAIRLAPPTKNNTKEVGFAVAAAQLFNSIQARAVIGGVFAGFGRSRS